MKKLILTGFFYLFSTLTHAGVETQISASQVGLDETFQLQLTQTNLPSANGVPDLTPLRKDFLLLGTERRVNYSIINGQTQSSSTWVITLKAQKTGTLTIPSLKIGPESTTPLTINVTTQATVPRDPLNAGKQQPQDIFITTEVNEKKPYLNQQIIYKVTLYNSKQLLDANYQGPKVENALLIPLGDGKRYQTQKNNIHYLVEEQNYAIFPQKSGPLNISPPIFTALIYDFNPQRIQAKAKPITLDVQPIPAPYTGKIWLPAKKIKLSEEYENVAQTVSQGSTLVRTITLEGIGIPAQLLPNLHFADTDAFNVYPEKGKEKNQIAQGEIVSNTKIKVTYLFNKSGKITIPEIKLPWFNTITKKEEIAILAPRSIEVTPSTTPSTVPTNTDSKPITSTTMPQQNAKIEDIAIETTTIIDNKAWMVAALFALAWLLTLGLWGWQKYHHPRETNTYNNTLKELHDACIRNNPQHARDALLKWARVNWPDASILNLTDLMHLTIDIHLKKQLQVLSQVLYQDTKNNSWHGDALWRSINNIKKAHPKSNSTTANVLPPINPN